MNQLFRPAAPTPDTAMSSPARDPRRPDGLVVSVEYDDGDPATVAVASSRPDTAPERRPAASSARSTPLASVPRAAETDYDDGDPATIVC